MPEYAIFPDAEAIAVKALKDAGICSGRIFSSRPNSVVLPMAIVQRLGGTPQDKRAIDNPRIQIDVWGSNKSEARSQAQLARNAIHAAEGKLYPTLIGYVTAVEDDTGLTWLPDPDTKEDRYVFGVLLTTRALVT
jgi:hypothetical protein